MGKVVEGVTIETFPQAVKQANIQPGQSFSIVLDNSAQPARPKLGEIAARMRATAVAHGLTTEIFDKILAKD